MSDTKQKILQTAIQLFNAKGVNNVTLRTIAEEMGISPGNLAYHYKNKESIIEEAFKAMEAERNSVLTGVQEIPSLEIIYHQVLPLYEVEKKYSFLNLDALHIIRNHPEFADLQRTYIAKNIDYNRAVISLSVSSGIMKPETINGEYDRLAKRIWMVVNFWLTQEELRGENSGQKEELLAMVWEQIVPHFTEEGLYKYQKLFARTEVEEKSDHDVVRPPSAVRIQTYDVDNSSAGV